MYTWLGNNYNFTFIFCFFFSYAILRILHKTWSLHGVLSNKCQEDTVESNEQHHSMHTLGDDNCIFSSIMLIAYFLSMTGFCLAGQNHTVLFCWCSQLSPKCEGHKNINWHHDIEFLLSSCFSTWFQIVQMHFKDVIAYVICALIDKLTLRFSFRILANCDRSQSSSNSAIN